MLPRKSAGLVVLAATVALTGVRVAANPGDLDPTFGTGGLVITSFPGRGVATGVAVQADGKIVAAGATNGLGDILFAVSRFNEDGSPDGAFGTAGEVTTSFGGTDNEAWGAALQADGKIVAVGRTNAGSGYRFALARYNGDGSLDATFGTAGQVTTSFGGNADLAGPVALQNDGKIVAAGVANGAFALARYSTDGSLDPTFGTAGLVTTSFGGTWDAAPSIALQGDGKIVAAGFTTTGVGSEQFALARYNSDGTLDGTFGTSGRVTTSFTGNDFANAVALQGDGKIVAAGVAGPSSCPGTPCANGNLFALARYDSDGSLDPTFGTDGDGRVTTSFGADAEAYSLALQADGKILAAGLTRTDGINSFALARYNGDGSLDGTFGTAGQVTTSFGGTYDQAYAVTLQGDGKIVAAGWTAKTIGGAQFALARYLNDAASGTTTTTTSPTTVTSTVMNSSTTTTELERTTSSTSSTTSTTLRPKACRRACRHEAKECARACVGTGRAHRLCQSACRKQRKNCGESTGCQLPPA